MFNKDVWIEILQSISKNKLRTFLSGFSVTIGVMIFATLSGFGNGLENTFKKLFADESTNIMKVIPRETSLPYAGFKSRRIIQLNNEDLIGINNNFKFSIDYITPIIERTTLVTYKGKSYSYSVRGVASGYQFVEKSIITEGRFVNLLDVKNKNKYAVIGKVVADDLFKNGNPIGKFIKIENKVHKVIGVFMDEGGEYEESFIYVPYTTRQLVENEKDKVDQIVVGFKKNLGYEGAELLQQNIEAYLKNKKKVSPNDKNGIYIQNISNDYKRNSEFTILLNLIISAISLAVVISGMIGISNIIFFSVREKTKEIGIKKALGATPLQILNAILLEAILITTFFGLSGMIIAIGLLKILKGKTLEENYFITNPEIEIKTGVFVTILLIICGVFASIIPARYASKIKPIVALRKK